MVAAPLVAAVKAQSEMSLSLAHFIQDVGIDKDGNMRMVTLKYEETSSDPSASGSASDASLLSLCTPPSETENDPRVNSLCSSVAV